MGTWVIISWILVALLTGVNIFVFLKLKSASEQMLKMAFPGTRNMGEALSKMQSMMSQMQGAGGRPGMAGKGGFRGGAQSNPQLQTAMEMLQKLQQGKK